MIAPFRDILDEHRHTGSAAGAFTCYETATAAGVVEAAEAASAPVILLVSGQAFARPGGDLLVSALVALAERATAPVCVQLDHVDDLDSIKRALNLGVGAIMADGSRLPLNSNVNFVREAIRIASATGAGVEAELGHIGGGEDVAEAVRAGALTDPVEAVRFVSRCDIDCLAVSIGNVHGEYAGLPDLDWPRLAEIRSLVDVPLSLHGASGLPEADVQAAVARGIAKINVNTELRRRAFEELHDHLPRLTDGYRMLELQEILRKAAVDVTRSVLASLTSKAPDHPCRSGPTSTSLTAG
jgi:ketose-bisphosphate aldolase